MLAFIESTCPSTRPELPCATVTSIGAQKHLGTDPKLRSRVHSMSDNTPAAPPPPEPSAPRPVPGPEPASSRGWKSELISLIRFSFGPLLGAVVLTATLIGGIYFYRAQDFDQIRTVNDVLTKTLTRVASVSDENMKAAAKIIKLKNEVVNLPIRLSPTPTICSVSPWTAGKGRPRRIEEAIQLILDCSENRTGV